MIRFVRQDDNSSAENGNWLTELPATAEPHSLTILALSSMQFGGNPGRGERPSPAPEDLFGRRGKRSILQADVRPGE